MKMTTDRITEMFCRTGLFKGMNPNGVFNLIKATFQKHQDKNEILLDEAISGDWKAEFRRIWKDPSLWSVGYCYTIVQAAYLMLNAANSQLEYKPRKSDNSKRILFQCDLPAKVADHWVITYGDLCFDPEKGAACPSAPYLENSTGAPFRNPTSRIQIRFPNVNTALFLGWIIEGCVETIDKKKAGADFLRIIRSLWKTKHYKPELKRELNLVLDRLP